MQTKKSCLPVSLSPCLPVLLALLFQLIVLSPQLKSETLVSAESQSTESAISSEDITNPAEILKKSRVKIISSGTTKTVAREERNGFTTITTTYKKMPPDGAFLLRTEFKSVTSKDQKPFLDLDRVVIVNNEGTWDLIGKVAIKKEYEEALSKEVIAKVKSTQTTESKGAAASFKYLAKELVFKGKNCFLVQKTISDEHKEYLQKNVDQGLAVAVQSLSKNLTEEVLKKINFKDLEIIPYLTEYTIRKDDYALLSEREFNKNGDLMWELVYEEVFLGIPLADNLFEVPHSFKIKKASSVSEYLSLRKEAIKNK